MSSNQPRPLSVVLAGGGTAGHTSPLIATAERILELEPNAQITCVGTPKGLENRVIPAAGLTLELIPPVPLPRKLTGELFSVPMRLKKAVDAAKEILVRRQADVVVGFGGYVSLPVYFAAQRLHLPIVIHEQNAVPGLANKVAAKFASVVAVSFPSTPLPKAQYVGLPVRASIASLDRAAARAEARSKLGFVDDRPTLLVSGGSQGAVAINKATTAARPRLLEAGYDVIHVVGPKNMTDDLVPINDPATRARYLPLGYVDHMEDVYAAADLMVGRSGAATVMETATIGLPVIFVPLPHGNGEQERNADFLVEGGAGKVVPNAALTAMRLATEVKTLLGEPEKLQAMSDACRGLVPTDAAGALAHMVLEQAPAHKRSNH